jgi:hypothetical protein
LIVYFGDAPEGRWPPDRSADGRSGFNAGTLGGHQLLAATRVSPWAVARAIVELALNGALGRKTKTTREGRRWPARSYRVRRPGGGSPDPVELVGRRAGCLVVDDQARRRGREVG